MGLVSTLEAPPAALAGLRGEQIAPADLRRVMAVVLLQSGYSSEFRTEDLLRLAYERGWLRWNSEVQKFEVAVE